MQANIYNVRKEVKNKDSRCGNDKASYNQRGSGGSGNCDHGIK